MKKQCFTAILLLLLVFAACQRPVETEQLPVQTESSEPTEQLPTPTETPAPVQGVEEADMLDRLKTYCVNTLPSSAASPYVLFADEQCGMIVFGEGETTLIYVTADGGQSWSEAEIPEAGTTSHARVTCAVALSANEYCIGYRYWGEYTGTDFYLTKDSGENWIRLKPESAISKEVTSDMRYAEAKTVSYDEDGKLIVVVSCKTVSGKSWSIDVELASADLGETWEVIRQWDVLTDAEE